MFREAASSVAGVWILLTVRLFDAFGLARRYRTAVGKVDEG